MAWLKVKNAGFCAIRRHNDSYLAFFGSGMCFGLQRQINKDKEP